MRGERKNDLVPLGDALGGLVSSLARRTDDGFDRIKLHWARIVGPGLARAARPVALEDGVLRVAVVSEGWRVGLEQEARRIVARLRAVAPVRWVRFEATGEVEPPPPAAAPRETPADPRNASVRDPALRQALDELAAARPAQESTST